MQNKSHAVRVPGEINFRFFFFSLVVLTVTACGSPARQTTIPLPPQQPPSEQLASDLVAAGEIAQAAQVYESLAELEPDPTRYNEYRLSASELYFDSEFYNQGAQIFTTLPPQFTDEVLQQRREILNALSLIHI